MEVHVARFIALGMLSFGLFACSGESSPPEPARDRFSAELDLARLLPDSRELVGVTSTPDGRLYVLDRSYGLFEVSGGSAQPVFTMAELPTRFGLPSTLTFTDIAALDSNRFVITAENDGYLLDLNADAFASYFCYLPTEPGPQPGTGGIAGSTGTGVEPLVSVSLELMAQGIPARQLTESVAFSPETQLLYAQPRTFRMDTGAIAGSELLIFSALGGGNPERAQRIVDPNFVAGGMIADRGVRLILATGNQLWSLETGSQPVSLHTFESNLLINGMTRAVDGRVILLDAIGKRLLWVDLATL
jgi:hypothetical protein